MLRYILAYVTERAGGISAGRFALPVYAGAAPSNSRFPYIVVTDTKEAQKDVALDGTSHVDGVVSVEIYARTMRQATDILDGMRPFLVKRDGPTVIKTELGAWRSMYMDIESVAKENLFLTDAGDDLVAHISASVKIAGMALDVKERQ